MNVEPAAVACGRKLQMIANESRSKMEVGVFLCDILLPGGRWPHEEWQGAQEVTGIVPPRARGTGSKGCVLGLEM